MSKPRFISADCPNCGAFFDRVPVDYDEDGNADMEVEAVACRDKECTKILCPCCDRFQCDACNHTFCLSHRVLVANGIYPPLEYCAACAAESEADEPITPIPPQRETGASASAEVA